MQGFLRIVPPPGSNGWEWRIDELGGDPGGLKGIVDRPVAVPYEYEIPGAHEILIELTGPEGTLVVREWVVVDDPSGYTILVSRPIDEILDNRPAEGIAIDSDGSAIYISEFQGGEVARLDGQTLATLGTVALRGLNEGLAVSPSGSRLFVAHKSLSLTVLRLPDLTVDKVLQAPARFFIHALNERLLLSGGEIRFSLVDVDLPATLAQSAVDDSWHFAVSAQGDRAAVLEHPRFPFPPLGRTYEPPALWIHAVPSMAVLVQVPLDQLYDADQIAWDSDDRQLFVLGRDEDDNSRMLIVDSATGVVTASFGVEAPICGYCVANPVATFGNGRYIAFERWSSVLVVDTEIDRPRFLFGGPPVHGFQPAGVAATKGSYELYVLGGPDYRVYRLRFGEP